VAFAAAAAAAVAAPGAGGRRASFGFGLVFGAVTTISGTLPAGVAALGAGAAVDGAGGAAGDGVVSG
jgi:hypothetical protein